jgi:hypothetical protein
LGLECFLSKIKNSSGWVTFGFEIGGYEVWSHVRTIYE